VWWYHRVTVDLETLLHRVQHCDTVILDIQVTNLLLILQELLFLLLLFGGLTNVGTLFTETPKVVHQINTSSNFLITHVCMQYDVIVHG
jgi:hypothetical protein